MMTFSAAELEPRLLLAVKATREAGHITLEYFRNNNFEVEIKSDDTPVTIADRRAEEYLRQQIKVAFPDDSIHGEEFSDVAGNSGFRWIIDPIDGTKSFIHGVPLYSNLVAVEYQQQSVIGVINVPALKECVYAARGLGAWYLDAERPPQKAAVTQKATLAEASFLTSEVLNFDKTNRRHAYDCLQREARLTRTWGDGYGYLLVATGRADIMVDPIMALWDAAPLPPIIEEAGGVFTDWQGNQTYLAGEGVATNPNLLPQVLRCLAGEEK